LQRPSRPGDSTVGPRFAIDRRGTHRAKAARRHAKAVPEYLAVIPRSPETRPPHLECQESLHSLAPLDTAVQHT
jgi:hypothetical protein